MRDPYIRRFFVRTTVRLDGVVLVDVYARTYVAAQSAALFLAALTTAACSLESVTVAEPLEADIRDSTRCYCRVRGEAGASHMPRWTRRALASALLDARRLARRALDARGGGNCSALRAFGGDRT